jgi:glycosyltransferase involved in cell wall biosynthesis
MANREIRKLRVRMLSETPRGGGHHYTAALYRALAHHDEIAELDYVCVLREQRTFGLGAEETTVFGSQIPMSYLAPPGHLNFVRKYARFFRNIARFLRELKQDRIVHIQGITTFYHPIFDLIVMLVLRWRGTRTVRTVHEMFEKSSHVAYVAHTLKALEWRLPTRFIVHNEYMKQQLTAVTGRNSSDVAVIPHGNYLGFRYYLEKKVEQRYHDNGVPTVLFFGVKRHKGLETFLRAWQMVVDDGHNFKAILAGTVHDEDRDLIDAARALPGMEIDARYIPNSELAGYFCRSSVVALPYLAGGTSGCVHLAYAFHRPVIASDIPCFQDVVIPGETGLVVERGNANDLKQAIVRMCSDLALCRRMGSAGFNLEHSPHLSWDRIAEQTIEVYETLASR